MRTMDTFRPVSDRRCYLVHGLVVSSSVVLPLPMIASRAADVTYRVGPAVTGPRASSFSRSDDPDDPWVVEHWHEGGLEVQFPGWATFGLSRDEIVLLSEETGDTDLVSHLLLDHVLPRVVALRGDLILHGAGAVGPSGRAHLLLGATGMGKSTLATALAAGGWPLLDDDAVRVVWGSQVPHAVPGYAGVRLLPDAAKAVVPDLAPGRPMAHGHEKIRFAVTGRAPAHAGPPGADRRCVPAGAHRGGRTVGPSSRIR